METWHLEIRTYENGEYRPGFWATNTSITCDDFAEVKQKIKRQRQWYKQQGFYITWKFQRVN